MISRRVDCGSRLVGWSVPTGSGLTVPTVLLDGMCQSRCGLRPPDHAWLFPPQILSRACRYRLNWPFPQVGFCPRENVGPSPTASGDGWWAPPTVRTMAAAFRGSHKLEAINAQAPQKSTVPSRQSLLVLPDRKFPVSEVPVTFRWTSPWRRERDRQGPCLASETAPLQNL